MYSVSQELIHQFSEHISAQMGIYFSPGQTKVLEKKLMTALPELGFKDVQECMEILVQKKLSPLQIEILAKHLTIGETYFFRDKNLFASLKEVVLPEIISRHQNVDRTLRIWSAACSSGEEAYSLAILVKELLPKDEIWNVRILATDLNPLFLQKARKGVYKAWSFRTMPGDLYEKYFLKENGESTVIPEVRSLVHFSTLNLMEDSYPETNPELKNLDLILCNNVLIYFSSDQIKKTIGNLTKAIVKEGWLSVSSVEVPFVHDPNLTTVHLNKTTLFKKAPLQVPKKVQVEIKTTPVEKERAPLPPPKPITQEEFYECCLSMYHQKRYYEVTGALIKALSNGPKKKRVREAKLLIQSLIRLSEWEEAAKWCILAKESDKLDKELNYLHAVCLQEMGEDELGLEALRASLYLDPDLMAAHFLSGILLLKMNREEGAKRGFLNTLKLIDKMESITAPVPLMEGITGEELKTAIILLLKEKGWGIDGR